jgi:hypothetical protein
MKNVQSHETMPNSNGHTKPSRKMRRKLEDLATNVDDIDNRLGNVEGQAESLEDNQWDPWPIEVVISFLLYSALQGQVEKINAKQLKKVFQNLKTQIRATLKPDEAGEFHWVEVYLYRLLDRVKCRIQNEIETKKSKQ